MKKPILTEVFTCNGEHSHWRLVDVDTGENLWSEDPEEDRAMGYPVKKSIKKLNYYTRERDWVFVEMNELVLF